MELTAERIEEILSDALRYKPEPTIRPPVEGDEPPPAITERHYDWLIDKLQKQLISDSQPH